jgi:hypothetical protein
MNISIVTSIDEFHSLKQEWNNLLFQSDSDVIFLRWEWLYNWWLVYEGGSNQLWLIVVKEKSRPIGIAPFYKRKGNWILPNEVRFLGSNIVCSDYLDLILLKGREKEIADLIFSFLNEQSLFWERICLSGIPLKSKNHLWITSYFGANNIRVKNPGSVCPYLNLASPWEKIFNSFSSNLKNIIKRKLKQFEVEQKGEILEVGLTEDVECYFFELVRLQKTRMAHKNVSSPFLDSDFLKFHLETVKVLSKTGNVKLMFLKVKEKIIAGIYLLIDCNKYYYYQSGFDPEWNQLSPGTLLFYYAIKRAHENGFEEFDFLQGEESYKSFWTKTTHVNIEITIYNQSMKSNLFSFIEETKERVKRLIKPVMVST